MIPKTIHYTWFSGEAFPHKIQSCIDSWRTHLSDYHYKLWDYEAIKNIDSIYLKEALAEKKWAYAADFVRFYAIYHEGGIYLDTDVFVYKSFDSLLNCKAFIGKENSIHFEGGISSQYLGSHCFGAEKGHPFIKACLDYYDQRHFITSYHTYLPQPLKFNYVLLPYIQAEIARQLGYEWNPSNQTKQKCKNGLDIFPSISFDPVQKNDSSFCRHLALGGWRIDKPVEPNYNLRYKIEWRLMTIVKWILHKAGYETLKID